jgi:prepilin-type N-terminal cleavage/methylation domain-containing protein
MNKDKICNDLTWLTILSMSKGLKFKICNYRGFTLIELSLAIFIFAIGILGVFKLFPMAQLAEREASNKTASVMLAQKHIETIRAIGYTYGNLPDDSDDPGYGLYRSECDAPVYCYHGGAQHKCCIDGHCEHIDSSNGEPYCKHGVCPPWDKEGEDGRHPLKFSDGPHNHGIGSPPFYYQVSIKDHVGLSRKATITVFWESARGVYYQDGGFYDSIAFSTILHK